jgi:long-chain acyl-CoA synthetase
VINTNMFRHTLVNHFLEQSARKFPRKTALIHQGKRLTYSEIDSMADRLAHALAAQGIKRGDRVAVFMDNAIEAVISLFGILKAGAAFMMINHTTKAEKLEYIMNNSRAKAILTQGSRADIVASITCHRMDTVIMTDPQNKELSSISFEELMNANVQRGPVSPHSIDLDLASIVYTSGSTGNPKGVMLSHLNMVSAAHSISTYLENTEHDIIINMLPLTFDYGLYQILMGFKIGGTVVLEKSFAYPAQVIKTMIEEKVTGFPGVPTMYALLLQMKDITKYDFSSLRYLTNTAAALPVSHIKKLRELFPQAKLYSMYGLTECKRVSYLPPDELEKRPTSVGKGMPNEEIYIVNEKGDRVAPGEVGELVVRGANVMLGYWELPDETARSLRPGNYPGERVLYTGDLFKMDKDGYFYFVARKDDIIKCKGEKVSPKEVENVLYGLEGVVEAAVVGVPDEIFGQAIKAFVALEKGAQLTEKDILRYCSQHLENYMVPKYVAIRDSLPKTATGKISKKTLTTAVA